MARPSKPRKTIKTKQAISISPNSSKPPNFHEMDSKRFEEMCCALMSKEDGIKSADLTKRDRQLQFGADIIAKRYDLAGLEIASCKCYGSLKKDDIKKFSNEFLDHWETEWKDKKVKRFVLCVAANVNAGEREAEISEEEKRFQSLGVTYDVWSPRQLQEKLRPHYGIANQYLNEFIAKQICGSPQAQISSPEHNTEHNTVIIGALTAELKNVLAEKTEKELEIARENVRQGKTKSISDDLEKLKNDKTRWPSVPATIKAAILRFEGLLALDLGKLDEAITLCNEAEVLSPADEPRLWSLIVREKEGAEAALKALGEPKSREGLHIQAGLLIEDGRAQDALNILGKIASSDVNAETHRLRAVAYMYLHTKDKALASIEEAERISPQWVSLLKTGAILRYHCALSPAVEFSLGFWPTSISPDLFLQDDDSQKLLLKAKEVFSRLANTAIDIEDKHAFLLWQMACTIGIFGSPIDEVRQCFNEIVREDTAHAGAIMWGLSFGISFDYASSKEELQNLIKTGLAKSHHVLALVALTGQSGDAEKALKILNENKELFSDRYEASLFMDWQERISASRKKTNKGFNKNHSATLPAAISNFRKSKNPSYLTSLCKNDLIAPTDKFVILSAFAEQGVWKNVEPEREFLIQKIQTAEAYSLAIFSAYNNSDYGGCLDIIKNSQGAFFGGGIPKQIQRLEISAAIKNGDVAYAHKQATKLVAKYEDLEDVLVFANTSAQLGDIETAIPYIQKIIEDTGLRGDQAIQLAHMVRSTKPALHKALVQKAIVLGIPDKFIPLAISEGLAANIGKQLSPLFGAMQNLAENNENKLISQASLEEVRELIQNQRKRNDYIWNLYTEGKIPIHLLFKDNPEGMAHFYWRAFNSDERLIDKPPLFLLHGSRKISESYDVPFKDWNLYLDITALFTAHAVGLLEKLAELKKTFSIPFNAQSLLQHMEYGLLHPQPDRIEAFKQIEDFNKQERLHVYSALPNEEIDSNVAYVRFSNSDDAEKKALENLTGLLEAMVGFGAIEKDSLPTFFENLGEEGKMPPLGNFRKGQNVIFEFNTIELIASLGILPQLCSTFNVSIEEHFYRTLIEEIRQSETSEKVVSWLQALRANIAELIRKEICRPLPLKDKWSKRDDLKQNDVSLSIFELFGVAQNKPNFVWTDDRCINGHLNAEGAPIGHIFDVLACMRLEGLVEQKFYFESLFKLRAASGAFIALTPEEVIFHLEKAVIDGDEIVETPSLSSIRMGFAKSLMFENKLNLMAQADYVVATTSGEFHWLLRAFRLADEVLPLIWQKDDISPEVKEIWSSWVWASLRIERFLLMPLRDPSTGQKENLFAMTISGLFAGGIGFHGQRDLRERYLRWIYEHTLWPRSRVDAKFLALVLSQIKRQILSLLKDEEAKDSTTSQDYNLMKNVLMNLIEEFPEGIKESLYRDDSFMSAMAVETTQTVSVNSLSFVAEELWQAIYLAVNTGKASVPAINEEVLDLELVSFNIDGSEPPALMLSGCLTGQISDPSLFLVKDGIKAEEISSWSNQYGWIDYPPENALTLIEDIQKKASYFQRVKAYEKLHEKSASYVYGRLEEEMAQKGSIPWKHFLVPDCETLARYIRMGHDSDDFENSIKLAALNLSSQYGIIEAYHRLSKLPVRLPSEVLSLLIEEHNKGSVNLVEVLSIKDQGIISTLHNLRLLVALRLELKITDDIIQDVLADLIDNWQEKASAYLQLLRWSDRVISALSDTSEYSAQQRASFVWLHAENISRIVFSAGGQPFATAIQKFSNLDTYNAERYFIEDEAYGLLAETPYELSAPSLLIHGLEFCFSGEDDALFLNDLKADIQKALSAREIERSISPFALEARERAQERLGGLFTSFSLDTAKKLGFDLSGLSIEEKDSTALIETALSKIESPDVGLDGWILLRLSGARWLSSEELERAQKSIETLNIVELLKKDRDQTLKAARIFSDYYIRRGNINAQNAVEKILVDAAQYLGSVSKGIDCNLPDASAHHDLHLLAEAIFAACKDKDLHVSLERFSRLVRAVVHLWPETAKLWRIVINNLIIGMRYEHSEDLWKVYTELKAIK